MSTPGGQIGVLLPAQGLPPPPSGFKLGSALLPESPVISRKVAIPNNNRRVFFIHASVFVNSGSLAWYLVSRGVGLIESMSFPHLGSLDMWHEIGLDYRIVEDF